jgi:hypothetical protein
VAAREGDGRRPEPPGPRSPPRAPRSSSRIPLRPPPHGSMPPLRILGGLLAGPLVPTVVPTGLLVLIEKLSLVAATEVECELRARRPFESAAHTAPNTKRAAALPEHHKRGGCGPALPLWRPAHATARRSDHPVPGYAPATAAPRRAPYSATSPPGPSPTAGSTPAANISTAYAPQGHRTARARSHPAIPRPGRPPEAAPHRLPPRVPTAAPERRQAPSAPHQPTLRTPAPGRPRRPRPADTTEDDLPDSSQHGNSSHPQRRIRLSSELLTWPHR